MNSFGEHLNFPSSPEVMDSPPQSPTNSIPLWRPGSSSYPVSKPVLDPVSSKAEMNKFYQSMAESDYDLSLRDLVDPTFSIDGDAIITSKSSSSRDAVGGDEDSGQKKGEWRRRRRKLYISALFLGSLNRLVGSQREKVVNGLSHPQWVVPSQRPSSPLLEMDSFLFTSESVNEGHPDKLCDQVSDAILDACLEQDPESKVACETCTKTNMVMVFGEITTKAKVDYEKIVRDTCREIGFVSDEVGLDADKCKVLVNIEAQSPDIAQGVHGHLTKKPEEIGAGDQGHMFGYATDETEELMPLSHVLATKLGAKLTEVRKNGTCAWLRPDGKTQVTVEYNNEGGAMVPVRVHTVLISTQHDETVDNEKIAADLKEFVIKPVIPAKYLDENTIFHLNPSGRFVIGGPHGDAGLTGRKIIIDTYGGWGAHGGGAFSGKDPTKVDRSGAYIVRQAAKSVVAAGLARRCLVQVSYAIGVPEPLSVFVDTYTTGKIPDADILQIIKENFDFRPGMMAIHLDLKRGGNKRYQKTAAYGHFGRNDPDFTWETVKPLKQDKM